MPPRASLRDRMRRERAHRFVGRAAERARFAAMLSGESPAAVLWIHGPGGIGKSTLLARLRDDAEAAGRKVIALDAHDVDPEPAAVWRVMARALGLTDPEQVPDALAAVPHVLTIDTHELWGGLDAWLRTDLVPALPDGTLVAIASRQAPVEWRLDPGLAALVEVAALRNLSPDEARELLARRGVGEERQRSLGEATHGHPLALALVAELPEASRGGDFRLGDAPDVVQALLDCLVRHVPSARHRQALFLAAEALATSEEALREAFGADDTPALYDWLRGLSFVQRGPHGLYPHDLARELLSAELRARDPDGCRVLHDAVRGALLRRLDITLEPRARVRLVLEALYLHRHNPVMGRFIDARYGTVAAEPLEAADREPALALVARRAGSEVAAVLACWIEQQPQSVSVYRDPTGEIDAISLVLELDVERLARAGFDPVAERLHTFLVRRGVQATERIHVSRLFVHRTSGLPAQPALNELQSRLCARWLSPPPPVWSFMLHGARRRQTGEVPDPWHRDPWRRALEYGGHHRIEELDVEVGEVAYRVYGHDWRRVDRQAFLRRMADLELATTSALGELAAARELEPLVLSEPEFRLAVRAALRDLTRDELLRRNPLLRSRCLRGQGVAGLRAAVEEAASSLARHPRDEKLLSALRATYLSPAPSQERAAERLGLPFSTYRRHLTAGVERVADWLWQRELEP